MPEHDRPNGGPVFPGHETIHREGTLIIPDNLDEGLSLRDLLVVAAIQGIASRFYVNPATIKQEIRNLVERGLEVRAELLADNGEDDG